jgi:outer membrane protein TolC
MLIWNDSKTRRIRQDLRRQLGLDDISYLALLNAEQTYQQAMINLVQSLANRYADTAALFQTLGGGWWKRSDVPAGVGG